MNETPVGRNQLPNADADADADAAFYLSCFTDAIVHQTLLGKTDGAAAAAAAAVVAAASRNGSSTTLAKVVLGSGQFGGH